jgi:glycosyltransferase involved in cell wall biosynthesis
MGPLVSIIVPVYNVEKYVKCCIDSIISQNYNNIEIIIINDGSTDDSLKIVQNNYGTLSNVRIISQENRGLSEARNTGIDIANGEYLMFVDSDDFLLDDILRYAVSMAVKYQADIVSFGSTRCSENEYQKDIKAPIENNKISVLNNNLMYEYLVKRRIPVWAWAKLYSKKAFDNVRFPSGRLHEDIYTMYRNVDKSKKIVLSTRIGYAYRYNSESISNFKYSPRKMDIIRGYLQESEFISQHYPSLKKYAYRDIIYGCNIVTFSMLSSKKKDLELIKFTKPLYRHYEIYYLFSDASIRGKLFSLIICICPSALYKKFNVR